jgi:hypothetical protein
VASSSQKQLNQVSRQAAVQRTGFGKLRLQPSARVCKFGSPVFHASQLRFLWLPQRQRISELVQLRLTMRHATQSARRSEVLSQHSATRLVVGRGYVPCQQLEVVRKCYSPWRQAHGLSGNRDLTARRSESTSHEGAVCTGRGRHTGGTAEAMPPV